MVKQIIAMQTKTLRDAIAVRAPRMEFDKLGGFLLGVSGLVPPLGIKFHLMLVDADGPHFEVGRIARRRTTKWEDRVRVNLWLGKRYLTVK